MFVLYLIYRRIYSISISHLFRDLMISVKVQLYNINGNDTTGNTPDKHVNYAQHNMPIKYYPL